MAKRRKKRLTRAQKAQRDKMYLYGGMGLVVLAIIAIIVYSFLNRPPEVSAERLDLDPVITAEGANPEGAEVTIIEYGAYGCPSCRGTHQSGAIDRLIDNIIENPQYAGRVNFVFVNFPVISPRVDRISAEAAQCVLDIGNDEFWLFHNAIYDLTDRQFADYTDNEDYVALANSLGIDGNAVGECLENKTHRRTVDYNEDRARDASVTGTPTFHINGQRVDITNISSIEAIVRRELGL